MYRGLDEYCKTFCSFNKSIYLNKDFKHQSLDSLADRNRNRLPASNELNRLRRDFQYSLSLSLTIF